MRRTRLIDLVVPLVVVAALVWAVLRFTYQDLPPLTWFAPVPLAVLGIAELVAARRVRGAVRHERWARPMTAIVIARCVALGKASSVVGAAVLGAAIGLLVRVLPEAGDVRAAANDTRVGAGLAAAAALVIVAGLVLERAGIDPNRHRNDSSDLSSGQQ